MSQGARDERAARAVERSEVGRENISRSERKNFYWQEIAFRSGSAARARGIVAGSARKGCFSRSCCQQVFADLGLEISGTAPQRPKQPARMTLGFAGGKAVAPVAGPCQLVPVPCPRIPDTGDLPSNVGQQNGWSFGGSEHKGVGRLGSRT